MFDTQLTERITVRFSQKDMELLEDLERVSGMKKGNFIRQVVSRTLRVYAASRKGCSEEECKKAFYEFD